MRRPASKRGGRQASSGGSAMSEPTITVPVNLANPGQFFACCGLLELADRMDASATGRFTPNTFVIQSKLDFHTLKATLIQTECASLDESDIYTPALHIKGSIDLRLDWWQD